MMDVKIIAVLILLSMFAGTYYAGKSSGFDECKAQLSDKKDEATTEDKKSVGKVIENRKKEKVKQDVKIKKIYIKADPTNCRSTKLIDMGISL